jgi:putative endopeptidase
MKKFLSVSLLSVLIAFGLQAAPESKTAKNPPPVQRSDAKSGEATSKPATDENAKPIDPSNMDLSVKPADDFFFYANGGWIKRTEIPPEYSRWGSFNQLIEHNNDALHAIAEKAAKAKSNDPDGKKVGDYYASGMDEKTVEAMRTKPLQDELGKVDNMKDRQDVLKEIAHLHLIGVNAFFNFGSGQDDKDSTREIAQAVQGGLGMPEKIARPVRRARDQDVDAARRVR